MEKALGTLDDLAGKLPGDVRDVMDGVRDGGDRNGDTDGTAGANLWKMALYWTTGKQFSGGPPSLTTDGPTHDDETSKIGLPHIFCYRYVGTATYDDLPGYIRPKSNMLPQGPGSPRSLR